MPPEGIYGEVEPQSHWSSGDDNIDEIEQLGRMMSLEEERQRSARFQTRVRRAKERYSSIIQGETTPDLDETSSSDGGKKTSEQSAGSASQPSYFNSTGKARMLRAQRLRKSLTPSTDEEDIQERLRSRRAKQIDYERSERQQLVRQRVQEERAKEQIEVRQREIRRQDREKAEEKRRQNRLRQQQEALEILEKTHEQHQEFRLREERQRMERKRMEEMRLDRKRRIIAEQVKRLEEESEKRIQSRLDGMKGASRQLSAENTVARRILESKDLEEKGGASAANNTSQTLSDLASSIYHDLGYGVGLW